MNQTAVNFIQNKTLQKSHTQFLSQRPPQSKKVKTDSDFSKPLLSTRTTLNSSKVIQELAVKLNQCQAEIAKRNSVINSVQNNFAKMQQDYVAEKAQEMENDRTLESLINRQNDLFSLNTTLSKKLLAIENSNREALVEKGNAQINSLQQQKDKLKQQQLENTQTLGDIGNQEKQAKTLQNENKTLLKSLQERQRASHTTKKKEQKANETLQQKQQQLHRLEGDYQKLMGKESSLKEKHDQLQTHNQKREKGEQAVAKSVQRIQAQHTQLTQRLQDALAQETKLDMQMQQHQANNQKAQLFMNQAQNLEIDLKDTQISQKKIMDEVKTLQLRMKQIETDILQASNINASRAEESQKEVKSLSDQLLSLRSQAGRKDQKRLKEELQISMSLFQSLSDDLAKLKAAQEATEKELQQLQNQDAKILSNLNCQLCDQTEVKPVTCIPCGHSYCKACEKGYRKKVCIACGPKFTIEAVYRNELLDELIQLFDNFKRGTKKYT